MQALEWMHTETWPQLQPGELHVWRASLTVPDDVEKRLYSLLSDRERESAERLRFADKRRQYVVGNGFLREMLGHYLIVDPAVIILTYNKYGKPALDRAVGARHASGPDLRFNASHSGDLVLYAFVLDQDVGVDVERIRMDRRYKGIARRFFHDSEMQALERLPESGRIAGFYRCWTSKEAYLKALGYGLSMSLKSFEIALPPKPPALLWRDERPEEPSRWQFLTLDVGDGYAAMCVVEGPRPKWRYWVFPHGA